jgi:hypothetical protein
MMAAWENLAMGWCVSPDQENPPTVPDVLRGRMGASFKNQ